MNQLKQLQIRIIRAKDLNQDYISLENAYNVLLTKLIENPTISEYLELKEHLNAMLQEIKAIIEDNLK